MPVVHVEAEITPEQLLDAVSRLDEKELDTFAERVLLLRAQRRGPSLTRKETELLMRINEGLPIAGRERYRELSVKEAGDSLTAEEHDELLRLTDQREHLQARRLEAVAELAGLRGVAPDILMDQLGLRPEDHGQ